MDLREAASGDFASIIERFNLPRSEINKLKAQGVPALESIRRVMKGKRFNSSPVHEQIEAMFKVAIADVEVRISACGVPRPMAATPA